MHNAFTLDAFSRVAAALRASRTIRRNAFTCVVDDLTTRISICRGFQGKTSILEISLVVPLTAVLSMTNAKAQGFVCHDGSPASVMDRASSPEYVLGDPQSFPIKRNGKISSIQYVDRNGDAIYQGDLMLGTTKDLKYAARLGPVDLTLLNNTSSDDPGSQVLRPFANVLRRATNGGKWPNATIPYQIDANLPQQETILEAMKVWSEKTPVKFVERTQENASEYKNFVYFTVGKISNACISDSVGMKGGMQHVYLATGCEIGQILHEIGHVIALEHEMTRYDRDRYVKIDVNNIISGFENQFSQYSGDVDVGSYDYDSIMHYQPNAFSCNGTPTIVSVQPGIFFGQRDHLSDGDIAAVKEIYK